MSLVHNQLVLDLKTRISGLCMDKLWLTGRALGQVFNFRSGCMCHSMHLWPGVAKQLNLELKTRPKQLLGSLPLVIALPGLYYKPMTIINDDARFINKLEASHTDDARVIIYNHHMFIVQATGLVMETKTCTSFFQPLRCIYMCESPVAKTHLTATGSSVRLCHNK